MAEAWHRARTAALTYFLQCERKSDAVPKSAPRHIANATDLLGSYWFGTQDSIDAGVAAWVEFGLDWVHHGTERLQVYPLLQV